MEELELKPQKKEEEENLVNGADANITEEKIEESLNYDSLTEAEKKAVDEFNSKIDINDSTQVLQYGAKAQSKISQF